MKNEWNLRLLFEGEEQWRETVASLPEQAAAIGVMLKDLIPGEAGNQSQKDTDSAAGAVKPGSNCGDRTAAGVLNPGNNREDRTAAESLEKILHALEMMITDSAHAEIWLSCMTTLHPVDPHYASLSDLLDRSELGELPLMKEIQSYLRRIPDLENVLASDPYLGELADYCRHLKDRIIPLESLDGEPGGGWYRVSALMKDAFVEYDGEKVTWQELQESDAGTDWGEEMHACYAELHELFYEKYKDAAAEILLDELGRDEQDYRREGADSLTVYLGEYGFPEEAVDAMLTAVEEGLPEWYECKRKLDAYHRKLDEEYAEEEPETETDGEYDSIEENIHEEESDTDHAEPDPEGIAAQNEAAYTALHDSLLEQFADFHPVFRDMLEESFAGRWVWINDDPLAFMDQHASMVPGTSHSYIALSADCYLPAAAHELGHAWANACVKDQNILYSQNEILMEFPANLAALRSYQWMIDHRYEMIDRMAESGAGQDIIDYLRQRAESPLIYEDMLGETLMNIYDGYSSFLFERELRSRILTEKLTAEDLSDMYLKYRRRTLLPEEQERYLDPFLWVERHNLFTCRSYYNLPYIISMLLAYRVMGEIRQAQGNDVCASGNTRGDGCCMPGDTHSAGCCAAEVEWVDFHERLTGLLQTMNRRPAEVVLQEFFGEDIRSVEFWRSCMAEVTELFHMIEERMPAGI